MRAVEFNLDSLTDIVSNSIGILVMLAVLTLLQQEGKVFEVSVPIEHASNSAPVVFICREDRVLYVPGKDLFEALLEIAPQLNEDDETNTQIGEIRATFAKNGDDATKTGERIILRPGGTNSWDSREDIVAGRPCPTLEVIERIDGKRNHAFFFVFDGDDGMNVFEVVRKRLLGRGVKCGWRPVDDANPIVLAPGDYRKLNPSFVADSNRAGGTNDD